VALTAFNLDSKFILKMALETKECEKEKKINFTLFLFRPGGLEAHAACSLLPPFPFL
jgi:hypothetical protein